MMSARDAHTDNSLSQGAPFSSSPAHCNTEHSLTEFYTGVHSSPSPTPPTIHKPALEHARPST